MARLTTRIKRLEALDGARAKDKFTHLAHLSEAELNARICQAGERLTAKARELLRDGMSIADMVEATGWPADHRMFPALLAEAQAPAFDAARYLDALQKMRGAAR